MSADGHANDALGQSPGFAVPDPEAAASMFFAMLRGNMYLERILGLRGMPDDGEINDKARGVAEAFSRAYKA